MVTGSRAIFPWPEELDEEFRKFKEWHNENKRRLNPVVLSALAHLKFVSIHPFSDGNGRMGRLWQYAMLVKHHPLFEYIPFESVIREHQKEYYEVLRASDQRGDSTSFIEFCLRAIQKSLGNVLEEFRPEPMTTDLRLEMAKEHFQKSTFSRKDYRAFFKTLSTATASRDLSYGVEKEILQKEGEKALARYRFLT